MENIEIKKCLFPAAGYGTRFLPATKTLPKEMLPILTKPLLQYGVQEALNANCTDIAIVTSRGKRAIEDYFDINYELEDMLKNTDKKHYLNEINNIISKCSFSYTRQTKIQGLGDAILCGEKLIGNEPFGVILADDLCHNDENENVLLQMIKLYNKYKCSIVAIEEIDIQDSSKYGIIKGSEIEKDIYQITNMVEKPNPKDAPSNLAIIGRYILTPDIFDILRNTKKGKNNEIQITDALMSQVKKNKVIAYKFKGKRFDCGSIDGFIEATNYFYKNQNK